MIDNNGEIVTSDNQIKDLALDTFKKRLEQNKIKPEKESLETVKNDLFDLKMKKAQSNKTPPWKMAKLENVLKSLNLNKARDPDGFSNILLRPGKNYFLHLH